MRKERDQEGGLGRKSLRLQHSSANILAGLIGKSLSKFCLRNGLRLASLPDLAIGWEQPGGNMALCEHHHRYKSIAAGPVSELYSLWLTLRGQFEQCIFVPTTPAPGPPGISTLSPCFLVWDQSSLVCSQGNCFFLFSQTPGLTICLGLLKLWSRVLAPRTPS